MEISALNGAASTSPAQELTPDEPSSTSVPSLSPEETEWLQVIHAPLQEKLSVLAEDENAFHGLMKEAYGTNYHASVAENIRRQTLINDFSYLPEVRFVDSTTLDHHAGAYSADKRTVFLNQDAPTETLQSAYIEEVGHHLDALMNQTDAHGDEGALFRLLLTEGNTADVRNSPAFLAESTQNDQSVVQLNQQETAVEFTGLEFVDILPPNDGSFYTPIPGSDIPFDPISQHQNNQNIIDAGVQQGIDQAANQNGHQNTGSTNTSGVGQSPPPTTSGGHPPAGESRPHAGQYHGRVDDHGQLHVNWSSTNGQLYASSHWLSDEQVLDAAYRTYLGRTPDNQGKEDYLKLLSEGGISQKGMVDNIKASQEYKNLNRAQIDREMNFYLTSEADESIRAAFPSGHSVYTKNITHTELVDTVYETLLGRPAEGDGRDQAGRDYWRNALDQGDITSVGFLEAVEHSTEYQQRLHPELRQTHIAQWATENADGVSIAQAMNDQSALGALSVEEKRTLLNEAMTHWRSTGNVQDIRNVASDIQGSENRQLAAEIFATPAADTEALIGAGDAVAISPEAQRADREMLQQAIQLDAGVTLNVFKGNENALGKYVVSMEHDTRSALIQAVADGKSSAAEGTNQLVTAILLGSHALEMDRLPYRQALSQALAQGMADSGTVPDQTVDQITERYNTLLGSQGGRALLLNDRVTPQQRAWAAAEVGRDPQLNAATLAEGWESAAISQTLAEAQGERYQQRGNAPQQMSGETLRNTIGLAMGITPDRIPGADESHTAKAQRLDAGMGHAYFGPNERIDTLANTLRSVGGDTPAVTLVPVTVTNNHMGAITYSLFKVTDSAGKDWFVDTVDPRRSYEGIDDWRQNNTLPPGQMTYSPAMMGREHSTGLVTEATPRVVDTLQEWAADTLDDLATAGGIVAGVLAVTGSGGSLALPIAGVSGSWVSGRAVSGLTDNSRHGVNIFDMSDEQVRSQWLDAAAGTLSVAGIQTARAALQARSAETGTTWLTQAAARTQLAANTADAAAVTNEGLTLAAHWDQLSPEERTLGLLNIAFWGGMAATNTTAGGAALRDAASFQRLENTLATGTPFRLERNTELADGEVKVRYDFLDEAKTVIDPASIRLEYGGAQANKYMLDLHNRSARQIEVAGGLLDRLKVSGGNTEDYKIGTAAWEAQLEITKIQRESADVMEQLGQSHLSDTERHQLLARQEELDQAILFQNGRFSDVEAQGIGMIEAPAQGPIQAQYLGYPDAPEGHAWVAGPNDTPFLRRYDAANTEKWYFDVDSGDYNTTPVNKQQIHIFASVDALGQIEHGQLAGKTVDVTVSIQGQPDRMTGRFEDIMHTLETERNQAVQRRNDALARGDETAANVARQDMRIASEKIGEVSAQAAILHRYPNAIQLEANLPGAGKNGQFDQIYLDPVSNRLIIVEAKGGSSDWGSRIDLEDTRAQQGSGSYMESVIANYQQKLKDVDDEKIKLSDSDYEALSSTVEAFNRFEGRIDYIGVKQKAGDSGILPSVETYRFDITTTGRKQNDR